MARNDAVLVSYALLVPKPEVESSVIARRVAVGRRIRDLREEARISQAAVAETAGLSRPFYVGVEAGQRNVSLDKLFAIADALGVDASVFFAP
ncbi:helix-turn-helix domain-containing protein [Actinomadura viridis]|uniref:helix-turn-helix domain-containing protein n=1 Tax=Actinomadura viridis TaxID=58110 RepID=UPI003687F4BD